MPDQRSPPAGLRLGFVVRLSNERMKRSLAESLDCRSFCVHGLCWNLNAVILRPGGGGPAPPIGFVLDCNATRYLNRHY